LVEHGGYGEEGAVVAEKLKDMFFTKASVTALAKTIAKIHPDFPQKRFINLVFDENFEMLELKARMRHTTECLRQTLPQSYKRSLGILKKAAPHVKGFEAMCLPDYVELYGLDVWQPSLDALARFTRYSSSEFAIRPFINQNPTAAMAFMKKLAADKNPNVRRFASEGCRPRLPWAMAIPAFKRDPALILPILAKLKNDESEFVRRSVANNLNDISKDHPEIVLDLCEKWSGKSANTDWIVKHACRSLLKAGNRRAMLLFGFGDPKLVKVTGLTFDKKKPAIGDKVQFTFTLDVRTKRSCQVRLEYVVYFAKARYKISKKVFKISEKDYEPGRYSVKKKHSFADMSTRKHYAGKHEIAIVVNGVEKSRQSLILSK
jgi:3-methyladenine DNA glycosylase AlkC